MSCVARYDIAGDEFRWARRCALCIQRLYHRSHFTVGGCWNKSLHLKLQLRCYCENSRNPASACAMLRQYSISRTSVASRNKWLNDCGTSGKLTLWTTLIFRVYNDFYFVIPNYLYALQHFKKLSIKSLCLTRLVTV